MAKVILISGCSSGFGLLAAVEAARRGHKVVATLRDVGRRAALDQAASAAGVELDVLALDVNDAASIQRCVAEVLRRHGRIDALVNNAGFGMGGTVFDLTMDELRAQMETNFFGAVALSKAVLPAMLEQRSGRIINVTSVAALHATPGMGAYNASKWALEGLSEAMRYELAGHGIRVCTVLPGMYKTEVFAKRKEASQGRGGASPFERASVRFSAKVDRLVAQKGQDPKEVSDLICDLIDHANPPARTVVGRDAKMQGLVRSAVPERLWEHLVRRVTGF